jgi:hypothetical protein
VDPARVFTDPQNRRAHRWIESRDPPVLDPGLIVARVVRTSGTASATSRAEAGVELSISGDALRRFQRQEDLRQMIPKIVAEVLAQTQRKKTSKQRNGPRRARRHMTEVYGQLQADGLRWPTDGAAYRDVLSQIAKDLSMTCGEAQAIGYTESTCRRAIQDFQDLHSKT